MTSATIGDDVSTLYEFEWDNGRTRTSDEIGDLSEVCDCTIDDIVDRARADPECSVTVIGFDQGS